jgi:hypothetical protein
LNGALRAFNQIGVVVLLGAARLHQAGLERLKEALQSVLCITNPVAFSHQRPWKTLAKAAAFLI